MIFYTSNGNGITSYAMAVTKRNFKDRRGQHGRRKTSKTRNTIISNKKQNINCRECFAGPEKQITDHLSGTVICSNCGLELERTIISDGISFTRSHEISPSDASLPYRRINYFTERLRAFCADGPTVPFDEISFVSRIICAMQIHYPVGWADERLTKIHFAAIFRTLKHIVKDEHIKYDTMLERWNQFRVGYIANEEIPEAPFIGQLKRLFIPVAETFRVMKDDIFCKKADKNLPSYDIITLMLMYNLSIEYVKHWGWYFLSKEIITMTSSTKNAHARVVELFRNTNTRMTSSALHGSDVDFRLINEWRHSCFRLKTPDMSTIIELCYMDKGGKAHLLREAANTIYDN